MNITETWDYRGKKKITINLATILVILVVATGGIVGVYAAVNYLKTISTTGESGSASIEVYSDLALTQVVNTIDWGVVSPSATVTKTTYIQNKGNVPVNLTIATYWAIPSQAAYFTFTSDYVNQVIPVGNFIAVTFKVVAAADLSAVPTWAFDIIITATKV